VYNIKIGMDLNEKYINLINSYFANELSEDEMNLLFLWVNQSEENKKIFEEYRKIWDSINKAVVNNTVNVNDEWAKINTKLFKTDKNEHPKNIFFNDTFKSFMKIAAGFAILITISFIANFLFNQFSTKKILANQTMIEYALPDSSIVTLNKGFIEYKQNFKNRQLTFSGEAFFEVKHQKKIPFTIKTDDLIIQDIGTAFYVNTFNQKNKIIIILKEGSIMLYSHNNASVKKLLRVGQKAEFDKKSGTITIVENSDPNYIAWKTKDIIFDNVSLEEAVQTLNKVYNSNIEIKNDDLKHCKITAKFHKQSLQSVLEVIKATLNLTVKNSKESIEIYGDACK